MEHRGPSASSQQLLLGELSLGLRGVHAVTGDSSEFLTAVVLVVDVVGDVLQILHVGPEKRGGVNVGSTLNMSDHTKGTHAVIRQDSISPVFQQAEL